MVVSGFVTSTRERRGRYEHLLARGVSEDAARRNIKTLPVIARAQAESYLQMALASANTVFDATLERAAAAERVEELKLFVSAGQQVVSTTTLDAESLGDIAEEAVALVGGEAGRASTSRQRARGRRADRGVARASGRRGLAHRHGVGAGALDSRKVVVAPAGQHERHAGDAAGARRAILGVLEVRLSQDSLPLAPEKLSRLGRFGQFVAIALEREDERVAVQRAMIGYAQLNELADRARWPDRHRRGRRHRHGCS